MERFITAHPIHPVSGGYDKQRIAEMVKQYSSQKVERKTDDGKFEVGIFNKSDVLEIPKAPIEKILMTADLCRG